MARSRPKTRRRQRSNPRGILQVMGGGYGFVQTAEGEYFIPATKMGGAFDGDQVEISVTSVNHKHKQPDKPHSKTGEKPSARVIRVIDRAHQSIIGRYEIAEPFGVIVPEDRRIPYDVFTMRSDYTEVEDGDIVRVRITEYPSRKTAAMGVIEEVIGHEGDEALGVEMIIARHKLEVEFSEASLEQASKANLKVDELLNEGYRDLRGRRTFTIDPIDARDFDDALSFERRDDGWLLGVHIADVSQYVDWNSSIDLDARRRATSVYLVDRVIPMLPEALSNELCSLKPHEDRAVMSVDMYLDKDFQLKSHEIYPSLICSSARFSYDEVLSILEGNIREPRFYDTFSALDKMAQSLFHEREVAGGLDFPTTEAKVVLDEEGKPLDIVLRKKNAATSIIEEAMILANTTVATSLYHQSFPSIYRIHEAPAADSLAELVPVFKEFEYLKALPAEKIIAGNPLVLQKALELARGREEEELISSLLLRAMKRAHYSPTSSYHYGLARDTYTHFTSPIRRYPDLVVHRMLKALLKKKSESFEQQVASLSWIAEHASNMERVAEAAARESQELKIVEFMESEVGSLFDAVVSGVTSYGLFVRLANTAEGLISLRTMTAEYYAFDPALHTLTGEESGVSYRLGQKLRVVLVEADARLSRLNFRLADHHG